MATLAAQLESEANSDADWWRLARRVVEFALGTAMRRGEIIGLRWRDVELLDRRLHVRETIVRGKTVTPKSRRSRRTMELGAAHRQRPRRGVDGQPLPV